MSSRKEMGPVTSGKVNQSRVGFRRLDVRTNTLSAAVGQDDFAAHLIVAAKFGLRPHLARVVCELAGIGRAA